MKIKIKIPTIPNYTASIYAGHSDSIWFSILFFKSTNQMMSERKLKTLCERASVGKSKDVFKILVGTVVVILTSILSLTMLIDEAIWLRNFTDLKQKSNSEKQHQLQHAATSTISTRSSSSSSSNPVVCIHQFQFWNLFRRMNSYDWNSLWIKYDNGYVK